MEVVELRAVEVAPPLSCVFLRFSAAELRAVEVRLLSPTAGGRSSRAVSARNVPPWPRASSPAA
jgi:hypothetical protein